MTDLKIIKRFVRKREKKLKPLKIRCVFKMVSKDLTHVYIDSNKITDISVIEASE